jgi:hypothetical protein
MVRLAIQAMPSRPGDARAAAMTREILELADRARKASLAAS